MGSIKLSIPPFRCLILAQMTLAVIVHSGSVFASAVDELGSPSQVTRDASAKAIRNAYTAPSRARWDSLASSLNIGSKQADIEARLRSSNVFGGESMVSGNAEIKIYRLDDLWMLMCTYTNSGSTFSNSCLAQVRLREQMRNIWVDPPTNFTGFWRTYWVNGQPSHQFEYKNGLVEALTTYDSSGSKSVVTRFRQGKPDGMEVGFDPSGHTNYIGFFKGGVQAGTWIWYNEDGSIKSKREYSKE
jgi:hypothetical protein